MTSTAIDLMLVLKNKNREANLKKKFLLGQKEATARIRGGLKRAGPNELIFVYNSEIYLFQYFLFCLFVLLLMFPIFAT